MKGIGVWEMKQRIYRIRVVLITVLAILIYLTNMPFVEKSNTKIFTLPSLPQPIAKTPAVITSAGQGTDTYIIRDMANQLMIRSYFMPQAKDIDLEEMNTVVFVVGYSSLGAKLQDISYEEEKSRIEMLLAKAEEDKLKIITVAIGGESALEKKTEELLRLVGAKSDYFIGIRDSYNESILIELAKETENPLTLVGEVKDITGPFASAFR